MTFDPRGKVAVVTGASSGIGEATTRRLATAGMTVYAVARRTDRLEQLARRHPTVVPCTVDVTDRDAVDALARRVRDEHGFCSVLVNNAGIGGGAFDGRGDLDDALRTLDVNVNGVLRCTAAFADLLEAGAPAFVVNVASVAGKLGIGPAAYAASKFAVVGFSEALALSWRSRRITVCQLNPGFIETEGFPQTQAKRGPMARLVGRPELVADAVVDVIAHARTERTVPAFYRAFVTLRHLAPPLYTAIARRMERAGGTRD
ncbi:SDR family NAD(P)-dependent oxidoreductase [Egicoccus halophilus]|uniref:Ketoreductase domain-containing protein n=1 Tax=Egicoccus halophilus TaxID=1670830 RepID=A0A8J3AGL1_9ACTN|nr:SDR family oxidoreductase [Egicoccus halophilus]GGI08486.1 hypothetical protein GCM10011354_29320 [Egicoccus halophilus]